MTFGKFVIGPHLARVFGKSHPLMRVGTTFPAIYDACVPDDYSSQTSLFPPISLKSRHLSVEFVLLIFPSEQGVLATGNAGNVIQGILRIHTTSRPPNRAG